MENKMSKMDVYTVMYQKVDGKLSICNFVAVCDAIKKVDELKDSILESLKKECDAVIVLGNHREFVITGITGDGQKKAIVKIVPSALCVPNIF